MAIVLLLVGVGTVYFDKLKSKTMSSQWNPSNMKIQCLIMAQRVAKKGLKNMSIYLFNSLYSQTNSFINNVIWLGGGGVKERMKL